MSHIVCLVVIFPVELNIQHIPSYSFQSLIPPVLYRFLSIAGKVPRSRGITCQQDFLNKIRTPISSDRCFYFQGLNSLYSQMTTPSLSLLDFGVSTSGSAALLLSIDFSSNSGSDSVQRKCSPTKSQSAAFRHFFSH